MIMKKDGRRELFNRDKVRSGMLKACEKRNISVNAIEEFIDEMERDLREAEDKEIPAAVVGEKIMAKLHELDDVAYVRFASVYREFKDVNDFVLELKKLLSAEKAQE
jgi:transcriptional repressor NrdR